MSKMAAHMDMTCMMDDLTAQDLFETTAAEKEGTARVCELCLKQPSKYKCPRCGVAYCSLPCYRGEKHTGCSEKFYKEHYMEVMKDKKGSEDDRKRMLEILQRVDAEYKPLFTEEGEEIEEEEVNEEAVQSLEERLAGLDLDKDIDLVWERLTVKERKDFETVLHAGKLGDLVPIWKPWWEQHDQDLIKEIDMEPPTPPQPPEPEGLKEPSYVDEIELDLEKMAEDLGLNDKDEQVATDDVPSEVMTPCQCPSVLEKIPKLNELLRNKKPSECVIYNLLNILFSYACAVRLYNGAHGDLPVQVAQNILELSATLSDNANFMGAEESLASAIHNSTKSLSTSNTFSTSVLRDVTHILLGGASDSPIGYIQSALSDLHRLFGTARKQLAKESEQPASDNSKDSASSRESKKELQRACFNCQKKLEFLLAWAVENKDWPRTLVLEVESMHRSRRMLDEQHGATKSALEKQWGGTKPPPKPKHGLIEELS